MSPVLKTKINAAQSPAKAETAEAVDISAVFEPFQNSLCERLQAITGEEFEPSDVSVEPVTPENLPTLLAASDLKILFSHLGNGPDFLGKLSTNLVGYVARRSLLCPDDSEKSTETYAPTKLDCLLLSPIAELASAELGGVFKSAIQPQVQLGLTFQDINIGKPQIKAFGELSHITISVAPSNDEVETDEAERNSGLLSLSLLVPKSIVVQLETAGKKEVPTGAPVLDPTHPWAIHMRDSVNRAQVPVRAVVENCSMSVAECTRLEIGQVIGLPGVSLDSVRLCIDMESGPDAKQIPVGLAQGSLGIFKKNRALKMSEEVDPDFIQGLNLHII